jgi:hypothetical protein
MDAGPKEIVGRILLGLRPTVLAALAIWALFVSPHVAAWPFAIAAAVFTLLDVRRSIGRGARLGPIVSVIAVGIPAVASVGAATVLWLQRTDPGANLGVEALHVLGYLLLPFGTMLHLAVSLTSDTEKVTSPSDHRRAWSTLAIFVLSCLAVFVIATMVPQRGPATATPPKHAVSDENRPVPPRFDNARIILRPGEDRAYVGFTIIGSGDNQYATPTRISAVAPDGRAIDWKHQTATGGPADIVAMEGKRVYEPATGLGGDADYFDAAGLKIGDTIRVTFSFITMPDPSGGPMPAPRSTNVDVPFRVVAAH